MLLLFISTDVCKIASCCRLDVLVLLNKRVQTLLTLSSIKFVSVITVHVFSSYFNQYLNAFAFCNERLFVSIKKFCSLKILLQSCILSYVLKAETLAPDSRHMSQRTKQFHTIKKEVLNTHLITWFREELLNLLLKC